MLRPHRSRPVAARLERTPLQRGSSRFALARRCRDAGRFRLDRRTLRPPAALRRRGRRACGTHRLARRTRLGPGGRVELGRGGEPALHGGRLRGRGRYAARKGRPRTLRQLRAGRRFRSVAPLRRTARGRSAGRGGDVARRRTHAAPCVDHGRHSPGGACRLVPGRGVAARRRRIRAAAAARPGGDRPRAAARRGVGLPPRPVAASVGRRRHRRAGDVER